MTRVLITLSVTILIFALTQLFLHLRTRQTLLREKLEALFFVMNETSQSIGKVQKGLMFEKDNLVEEGFEGIEKSIYDVRPYFLLYFPAFTDIWISQVIEPVLEFVDRVSNITTKDREKLIADLHQKTIEVRYLQNTMARNQDLTTETIRFHWDRLIHKKIRFNMPKKD